MSSVDGSDPWEHANPLVHLPWLAGNIEVSSSPDPARFRLTSKGEDEWIETDRPVEIEE